MEPRGAFQKELHIEAAPETVFSFFTDPDRMVRWMGAGAELDPRPGGVYIVDFNGRDIAMGEFVEVVAHERIVFTWGWGGETDKTLPPGASTVEVRLTPRGGGTLLTLVHQDLPPSEAESHAEGWDHFLTRLAMAAAEGGVENRVPPDAFFRSR